MHTKPLSTMDIVHILQRQKAHAAATIRGDEEHSQLSGCVSFYDTCGGTLVVTSVHGLPREDGSCAAPVFGMHIHAGTACTGTAEDPFADAEGHFNPGHCPHPHHAGDLPPLFGNSGYAWMAVLTNRFRTCDILGKTVILHAMPDDMTTQPSGNSGKKIACGVIRST